MSFLGRNRSITKYPGATARHVRKMYTHTVEVTCVKLKKELQNKTCSFCHLQAMPPVQGAPDSGRIRREN